MKKTGIQPVSEFAARLKQLRENKGLSQAELAEMAGVHHMHMSRYERGVSRPSADTLKRLAHALEVSGDYLMEGGVVDIAAKEIEDRDLLNLFIEVEKFAEDDKILVKRFLGAMVNQQMLKKMASG